MRAFAVVVLDVLVEDTIEMASPCDQEPVETFLAHAADEALGVGVGEHRRLRSISSLRSKLFG